MTVSGRRQNCKQRTDGDRPTGGPGGKERLHNHLHTNLAHMEDYIHPIQQFICEFSFFTLCYFFLYLLCSYTRDCSYIAVIVSPQDWQCQYT